MFEAIRNRLHGDEEGFTLIELMVVVLIIAILIAIAIPTFLGARSRAQDKQAQSNLRNALVTEDEFYTDNQAYSATNATMKALEPQLDWGNTKADQAGVVATLRSEERRVGKECRSRWSATHLSKGEVDSRGGEGSE